MGRARARIGGFGADACPLAGEAGSSVSARAPGRGSGSVISDCRVLGFPE